MTTNLEIFLVRSSDNVVVAAGNADAIANQTPNQIMDFQNTTTNTSYYLLILRQAGTIPGRIKYVNYGANEFGTLTFQFAGNSPPTTINPHAGTANTMAVAAAPFFNQRTPESFTSDGPTTILFDPSGNRLATPVVRAKPDITAPDGTSTSFFGSSGGFYFFGTSAAAPHAAAVAALYLQANPGAPRPRSTPPSRTPPTPTSAALRATPIGWAPA